MSDWEVFASALIESNGTDHAVPNEFPRDIVGLTLYQNMNILRFALPDIIISPVVPIERVRYCPDDTERGVVLLVSLERALSS